MTTKRFSNALGNIGVEYIDEAATYTAKRKKNAWIKWVSMAACLSLIIMGGVFGNVFRSPDSPNVPENNIMSYFAITAYAANGESTELNVTSSCISSGTPKYNIFGHDMPLFHFDVKPSDLENNEAVYERFDISISYNGTIVDGKDEHIMVGFVANVHHSASKPYAYSIIGWFTEPTDIIVNILDKESREIVETITVNVQYIADRQEYKLEVTDLATKFAEQREAAEASNALMEYFYNQGYVYDYPAYFGGCYIEGNKLYVKLVSPTDEEMKAVYTVLARYDEVVEYKSSDMSMSDLQAYADKTANELIGLGYAVTSWGVDSTTGNIVITVLEEDLSAVTAWVADMTEDPSAPKVIVEEGAYISAE